MHPVSHRYPGPSATGSSRHLSWQLAASHFLRVSSLQRHQDRTARWLWHIYDGEPGPLSFNNSRNPTSNLHTYTNTSVTDTAETHPLIQFPNRERGRWHFVLSSRFGRYLPAQSIAQGQLLPGRPPDIRARDCEEERGRRAWRKVSKPLPIEAVGARVEALFCRYSNRLPW
jgi:hypothetical protein